MPAPRRRSRRYVSPRTFRETVAPGAKSWPAVLLPADTDVKADTGDGRVLTFTISTGQKDRDRDMISPEGWDFRSYRKNPVVLFAHGYYNGDAPVIGTSLAEWVERGKVKSRMEFVPEGMIGLADTLFRLYTMRASNGQPFMRAASVGFLPQKYTFVDEPGREGGIDFEKQELLEWSLVPVPSNAGALSDVRAYGDELVAARAAGIDTTTLKAWAESVLDGWSRVGPSAWFQRELIEVLREKSDGAAPVSVPVGADLGHARLRLTPEAEERLVGLSKQGTEVQSVLFSKDRSPDGVNDAKGWTPETATAWLDEHDFASGKLDEGTDDAEFLRYRQFDPDACEPDSMLTLSDGWPVGVEAIACTVGDDAQDADKTAPSPDDPAPDPDPDPGPDPEPAPAPVVPDPDATPDPVVDPDPDGGGDPLEAGYDLAQLGAVLTDELEGFGVEDDVDLKTLVSESLGEMIGAALAKA